VIVLARPARWAALLAAGALAISGCGQVRLGAAAIVGDGRISQTTLAAEVANLDAGYRTARAHNQVAYAASAIPRLALSWLLRFRIRDQLAAEQGITVTAGQSQRALGQVIASVRQNGGTLASAAIGAGLPPDLEPALGRYVAIQVALDNKLDGGVPPTSATATSALARQFARLQCVAAKGLHITVSPQFGALDYSQLVVVPGGGALAAAPSGPARPPSSQRLTPPC
jgi:hypothetical protein